MVDLPDELGYSALMKEVSDFFINYFNVKMLATAQMASTDPLYPYKEKLISGLIWQQQALTVIAGVLYIVLCLFLLWQCFKFMFAFFRALMSIKF